MAENKTVSFHIDGHEPLRLVTNGDGTELVGVAAPVNMLPNMFKRYERLLQVVMDHEQAELDAEQE